MDRARIRELESRCTEEEPPACSTACPLQVDARALAQKAKAGDLRGALAVLARAAPLPRLLALVCDHPCEAACVRAPVDAPVALHELERAAALLSPPPPLPPRPRQAGKRVAVVGAGLCGLAAAWELGRKGFQVTVFEASAQPGGRLRALADPDVAAALAAELEVLAYLGVVLQCGHAVEEGGEAAGVAGLAATVDAVFLATGDAPLSRSPPFANPAPLTLATGEARVFAGGSSRRRDRPWSPSASVADGRRAAASIERLLQGASLTAGRPPEGPVPCRLQAQLELRPQPRVAPSGERGRYTADEARAEGARCPPCRCLACVKACQYLAEFGEYPKRYVRQIDNNDCIVMGNRTANKLVNSCALCGQCAELCPDRLDMGSLSLEARQSMVRRGKMPPSAHEFALRDLAFARGEECALARHAPGQERSAFLFFPGCQLAGSRPHLVERVYRHLRDHLAGGVALHLSCCGAPAEWAGRGELLDETLQGLARTWEGLGRPKVIAACPSCLRLLAARLPRAEVVSLWPLLLETGAPAPRSLQGERLAVHDACAARHDRRTQDAVRELVARLGAAVVELPLSRTLTSCCSQGGLMSYANPELAAKVAARRAAESDAPFVSYCAACADNFAAQGKQSVHLLDLLFGDGLDAAARRPAGYSQRQEARRQLKQRLLAQEWGERQEPARTPLPITLAPGLHEKLQRRMILEDELRGAIARAEESGERFEDRARGVRVASLRSGNVTCWVTYAVQPGGVFLVHDAWSHRMTVS